MKAKKIALILTGAILAGTLSMTGCGQSAGAGASGAEQVIIYSNADDEAVEAMKATLDANGYEGQYLFQTFGTSELGGKVMAEGTDIEADLLTLSTFYIDAAQEEQNMFQPLEFDYTFINSADQKNYCAPITSQEGTIIVNTEVLAENNLEMPTCLKESDEAGIQGSGFCNGCKEFLHRLAADPGSGKRVRRVRREGGAFRHL